MSVEWLFFQSCPRTPRSLCSTLSAPRSPIVWAMSLPVSLPVKIVKALLPSSILATWLAHFNPTKPKIYADAFWRILLQLIIYVAIIPILSRINRNSRIDTYFLKLHSNPYYSINYIQIINKWTINVVKVDGKEK